jgi:large subunit ribosomal protein L10
MSKILRRKMVDELAEKLKGQGNVVLVDAKGLTGLQGTELRQALREGKARMRLVKNSVALHALKRLGITSFEKHLGGMSALIFGADPLALAKKLVAYREKHQKPALKAALIDGREMDPSSLDALSKLPGREELLSTLLGTMNAVTQKFVSTLNEIPRKFVGTVQAVADREKK